MNIGKYTGEIADTFRTNHVLGVLEEISELLLQAENTQLSDGKDYVIKTSAPLHVGAAPIDITIKVFKRQSRLKDWHDQRNGSKAERSFRAACFLQAKRLGTPTPIAWLDYWEGNHLKESYYLCLFEPGISFRDALSDIYYNQHNNAPLMELLHLVAPAIRAMHDAGFAHNDMGNQNILLPRAENGDWLPPQFIDLNRAQYQAEPLSYKQRAFDLARIALPGAYLKIFKTIYNQHEELPAEFELLEQKARKRFWNHRRSVKWRHPIRHWRSKQQPKAKPVYPPIPDIWLWDEKSAQPMIVPGRQEKHAYRDWRYMLTMIWQSLISAPGIFRRYKQLLQQSYQKPLSMTGRIGVALHPKADYIPQELALLKTLGNPPVLVRFCHHETQEDWQTGIALVKHLHQQGVEIMVAILQDRQATLQPQRWESFLDTVISTIGDKVAHIEITHASNRVKWGIWSANEYRNLMAPAFALQKRYPHIKLTGPACIDFEYHPVIAALKTIPKGQKFSALSHLLYVDRRGAPEGKQGQFSTLEKCALLKALAQSSDRCDDKVIISEVNWPVKHTGIWSPIGCPYETPKWRREEPGETEDEYADYMLRYLVISLCSGHVDQVFWWRLSAHGYGLVDDRDNFRQRPAFRALAYFLQLLGNATFIKRHTMPEGAMGLEFTNNEQAILMLWSFNEGNFSLPDFSYQRAYNREGETLSDVLISSSPIYLVGN